MLETVSNIHSCYLCHAIQSQDQSSFFCVVSIRYLVTATKQLTGNRQWFITVTRSHHELLRSLQLCLVEKSQDSGDVG